MEGPGSDPTIMATRTEAKTPLKPAIFGVGSTVGSALASGPRDRVETLLGLSVAVRPCIFKRRVCFDLLSSCF